MINIPQSVINALKEGNTHKNYRFYVLSSDGSQSQDCIDNTKLVSESVKFDERLCSGDVLKFGLCEGASLEFEYFDYPNIKGKDIQCFLDVDYGEQTYTIPMGTYTVDNCPRQYTTGIYKVTAYNKLKSKYLDSKANSIIQQAAVDEKRGASETLLYLILNRLLKDFRITTDRGDEVEYETYIGKGEAHYDGNATFGADGKEYGRDAVIVNYLRIRIEPVHYSPNEAVYSYNIPVSALYNTARKGRLYWDGQMVDSNAIDDTDNTHLAYLGGWAEWAGKALSKPMNFNNDPENNNEERLWKENSIVFGQNKNLESFITPNVNSFLVMYIPVSFNEDEAGAFYSPETVFDDGSYVYDDGGPYHQHFGGNWELYELYNNFKAGLGSQYGKDFVNDVKSVTLNAMESLTLTPEKAAKLPDVTLRELQSAVFETECTFGQLDRESNRFSGRSLATQANDFFDKSSYSALWTDESEIQRFKYLIITYKGLDGDGNEKEYTLQRTVNSTGNVNYNMSGNWLFKNLTWTAIDIGRYADAMVSKMQNISWLPFEMWGAGLPYIETGDAVAFDNPSGERQTSYVLERQLTGIQNLGDTFINGKVDVF